MAAVNYFTEDISYKITNPRKTAAWIKRVALSEKKQIDQLNFIFCSDDYLLKINREYLNHNSYTDIITFPTNESPLVIAGDIFISVERVKENAVAFDVDFTNELRRVIIHGVLHLIGFKDKSKDQKKEMREKEDAYLSLW